MERSNIGLVAIAWFRPDEWDDLKRICPDLQDTYDEWLTNAETMISGLDESIRNQIMKVILTVDELRQWKRATGRKIDSKVRADLAMKIAAERNSTRH